MRNLILCYPSLFLNNSSLIQCGRWIGKGLQTHLFMFNCMAKRHDYLTVVSESCKPHSKITLLKKISWH